MIIRPGIGIGSVYLLLFLFAAFKFIYQFFDGVVAILCVASLLILFIYYRWPKFIKISEQGVEFEFYSEKVIQLNFNTIHRINTDGLFRWRIKFKNGGWSDVLNYSLLSKENKLLVYRSFIKYYEAQSSSNQQV